MSAFIDTEAVEEFALSDCYCPNHPHDHDSVTLRAEWSWGHLSQLARVHTDLGRVDAMAERARLLELGLLAWTFVDAEGKPVPLSLPMILLLKPPIADPIVERIDDLYQAARGPLPNRSGGQSQPSSPASLTALPNRAARRAAKRSTPKSSPSPAGPKTS